MNFKRSKRFRFVKTALIVVSTLICKSLIAGGDWQSLFDGKTLNGWKQLGGDAIYKVEDGMIVGATVPHTPNSFLVTKRTFGNFILELEFLADRGVNSGIQFRSDSRADYKEGRVFGYQFEIDSEVDKLYEKEPLNYTSTGELIPKGKEARNWTGGIYDERRRGWLHDLTRNEAARSAFRVGEWNHVRVEALGDSIRTWINGVPAAQIIDAESGNGFIALQVHATKSEEPLTIRFKDIKIKDYGENLGSSHAPKCADDLFSNGDLSKWGRQEPKNWVEVAGPADNWKVTPEGWLEVVPGAGSIITKKSYGSFYLHAEFRLLRESTNGGIYLQSRYEMDINESYGKAIPSLGKFANLDEPRIPLKQVAKPIGEWQFLDVEFKAAVLNSKGEVTEKARASAWLNGVLIHDNVDLGTRKGAARRLGDALAGPLMLQEHGSPYQFRNIWIIERNH